MPAISELAEDRVVEGIYAVSRKRRLKTRTGSPYLALELVDPSGRLEARVWNDVELLDARFAEGDAVRVLGRVERFRDRLQLDVRSIEAAEGQDPADARRGVAARPRRAGRVPRVPRLGGRAPRARGDGRAVRLGRGLRARLRELPATQEGHHSYAGGLLEHTVGVATMCRETAGCTGGCGPTCSWRRRCCTTSGRTVELGPAPVFAPTDEGRLLGHVHLGLRLVEERADALDAAVRAELLHAIACHHDSRAARTAEAAVLYHANQLDAVAATRPVTD